MKSFWNLLHKVGDMLRLPNLPVWLIGILALVLALRIPSFFEPYSYGDEMIYLTLGQGVRQGLTLYKDIHDNKPPLLYLTAALAGNLFWFKAILAFWNLVTIILFYKLSQILFGKDEKTKRFATLIFALLTTLPLLEGMTANSELFMIGFTLWALIILLKEKLTSKNIFCAGVLFGIGTLFKVPAALDAPIIVLYWFITKGLGKWKETARNSVILFAGFAAPIFLTAIYFFLKGALFEYIRAAFLQNIGYLSSFRPSDTEKPFLLRNAPLLTRVLVVFAGIAATSAFRKKISKRFVLLSIWTLLGLLAATLSERPYPHYFIQIAAPIAMFLAIFFMEKSFEQVLAILPLTLIFFVPVYYKFWVYPATTYYSRFINFMTGRIDKKTYFLNFSGTTNRNYQIADFLVSSSQPTDRVFFWDSDSPIVYALARRLPPIKYVVPYHVMDYSSRTEVAKEIIKSPPKFIILTTNYPYPELERLIRSRYLLIEKIGNASIYSRLDLAK